MDESYPADSVVQPLYNAGGNTHLQGDTGIPHPLAGEDPWILNKTKLTNWLDRVLAATVNNFRVYHNATEDSALQCSVHPGSCRVGLSELTFSGENDINLTNNQTNYIYLYDNAGTLTIGVSISSYPDHAVTPHFPLARITTSGGVYSVEGIVDDRAPGLWSLPGAGGELAEIEAVASTPHTITAGESGKTFTNEGATAQIVHTLPAAAAGLKFRFYVQDSDGLRVTAASGDTIRVYPEVSIAGGYVESTLIGAAITLLAINATEWVAVAVSGAGIWGVETS